jgi:hypothetical protein
MTAPSSPPRTWSLPPPPTDLTRRRIIAATIAVIVLVGGAQLIGIPKILSWRWASQAHARSLEEAVTGTRPTRQFSPDANFIELSGGFLPGDQQPVTIDTGTLATPARIDTVMANATKILTAHGYTQRDFGSVSYPNAWGCVFDGTADAEGIITTATTMVCSVDRKRGHEHVSIGVVSKIPPQDDSWPAGSMSGPDANIAPLLVTEVQITVKD